MFFFVIKKLFREKTNPFEFYTQAVCNEDVKPSFKKNSKVSDFKYLTPDIKLNQLQIYIHFESLQTLKYIYPHGYASGCLPVYRPGQSNTSNPYIHFRLSILKGEVGYDFSHHSFQLQIFFEKYKINFFCLHSCKMFFIVSFFTWIISWGCKRARKLFLSHFFSIILVFTVKKVFWSFNIRCSAATFLLKEFTLIET